MTIESVFDRHARDETVTSSQYRVTRNGATVVIVTNIVRHHPAFSSRRHGDSMLLCPHRGYAGDRRFRGGYKRRETSPIARVDGEHVWSPCRRPLNVALNVAPRTIWIFFGFFSLGPCPCSWFLVPVASFRGFFPPVRPRRSARHGLSIRNSQFTIPPAHDTLLAMVVKSEIGNWQFPWLAMVVKSEIENRKSKIRSVVGC